MNQENNIAKIENSIIKEANEAYKEIYSGDWGYIKIRLTNIYRKYAYSENKDNQQAMANILSKRASKDSDLYEIIYGEFGFNTIAMEQEELLPDEETFSIGRQYLEEDGYKKFLIEMNPCHRVVLARKIRLQELNNNL